LNLAVGFNGDSRLIAGLKGQPEVVEVYGKLSSDFIGGGKHSFQTPSVSKKRLAASIKEAHACGLEFNYLLNSTCLNNAEWTIKGQRKITNILDWLVKLRVDAVTVALPYLLELVKKRYPGLKVYVSDLAYVNTIRKAKIWEELGADRITLFNVDLNRDFAMLGNIRRNTGCKLQVILNANCLINCPFYLYHANTASHASQSQHPLKGFVIDYCRIRCRYQQVIEPLNFIRSTWIRPEDLHYYEGLGIDSFKIIDRGMTTKNILSIVEAYIRRRYDGNLLDLFPDPSKSIVFARAHLFHKIRYFLRPFTVNVFKLKRFSSLLNNAVYIDNSKLNGFIEGIMKMECNKRSCDECSYCRDAVEKAVRIDKELNKKIEEQYRRRLNDIISGDLFRYF